MKILYTPQLVTNFMIYHHTKLHVSLSSISLNSTIKLKAATNVHSFVMSLFYASQNSAIVKVQFFPED